MECQRSLERDSQTGFLNLTFQQSKFVSSECMFIQLASQKEVFVDYLTSAS